MTNIKYITRSIINIIDDSLIRLVACNININKERGTINIPAKQVNRTTIVLLVPGETKI